MAGEIVSARRAANGRLPSPRKLLPPSVAHGGLDYAELDRLGIDPADVVDFSVNSHPLGTSPRARAALADLDLSRYPDREALGLRGALADRHGVSVDEVVVGNGSVELIWLVARVYLRASDRVLVVGPTFGEYEAGAAAQQAQTVHVRAAEADGFRIAIDDLVSRVQRVRPRVLFVCNPNNPTGQILSSSDLAALLAAGGDMLLVVDEAYIDFADGLSTAIGRWRDPRVVVLRSLTKGFGLAGLRLGYAVAEPDVIEALSRTRPPWTVNAAAQAAGLAALDDWEHLKAGLRIVRDARELLHSELDRLGWRFLPTRANYWLVEVGDGVEVRRRLLREGILVRDCASFGLPDYIRVAARPIADCERLLGAVARLL